MQMTGDAKSRPSWRLSCHSYSYPECQLGRLVFGSPCERLGTQLLPIFNVVKVKACKQIWRKLSWELSYACDDKNVYETVSEEEIVERVSRFTSQLWCAFAGWLWSNFCLIWGKEHYMNIWQHTPDRQCLDDDNMA